jgi:ankyrin repeat protein
MNRNQYIKIEGTVVEISKIEIDFEDEDFEDEDYDDEDRIEDLGLEEEPNVLIYKNEEGNGDEFINIYRGARIMITTEKTINEDKYKKLPENVDYVIVDNRIYEVKVEFEMMYFKSSKRFMEYIGELERHGKINENNKNGETALIVACKNKMERVAMELIPKMKEDVINKWTSYGDTALIWACVNKMENVAMELISKMSDEAINKWCNSGNTALNWCCGMGNLERVAIELIPRMSEEAINRWNEVGDTALYNACKNKMKRVIKMIKDRIE